MYHCFPAYTVSGMLFTLTPNMIFSIIKPVGEPNPLLFYYWYIYMAVAMFCTYLNSDKVKDGNLPTLPRSQKLNRLRIWLPISLLLILIQQSAVCYLAFVDLPLADMLFNNLLYAIFVTGILSVFAAHFLCKYSDCLYHPLDFLDNHVLIFYFIAGFLFEYWDVIRVPSVIYLYIPFHYYVMKGIYIVFMDSSKIIDLNHNGDYVIFRTWNRKLFKGRIFMFYLFIIAFQDVEEYVDDGVWRKVDKSIQQLYVQCNIVSMKLAPRPTKKGELPLWKMNVIS